MAHSKPGPKPRLTPAVQSALTAALREGDTRRNAAALAGISQSSLYGWLAQAREEPGGPCAPLLAAIEAAEAEFEHTVIRSLKAQATGQPHERTKTITRQSVRPAVSPIDGKPIIGDDGQPILITAIVTETVTTQSTRRNPRIGLEWLCRRHPEEWAAAMPVNENPPEEDWTYQTETLPPPELSPEDILEIYHDVLAAREEAAAKNDAATDDATTNATIVSPPAAVPGVRQHRCSPSPRAQKALLHRCRPLGQQVVPHLRSPYHALHRPLRPLSPPGRVSPLAPKPRIRAA